MEKKRKRKRNITNFTKEQKLAFRRRQVKRQKFLLTACGLFLVILIAALLFFILSRPKEDILQINAACESYRDEVTTAAAKYGMSDYVDLILAVMMQESSGQGTDVMQSAEGAYNTKYPQTPGGITDPSYSIECGIQELKYAMDKAGVKSPADIEHIRLALQAYNFGADVYFSFMEEQGETVWSEESAEAFAQMASGETLRAEDDPLKDPAGPWAYGDQRYPEHVLRYYHPETQSAG